VIHPEHQFTSVTRLQFRLGYYAGIREDGTFRIWAKEKLNIVSHRGDYEWVPEDLQIGNDTNWVAVAGSGEDLITLRNDGSLWQWHFHFDWRRRQEIGDAEHELVTTTPKRLGTHSDWVAVGGLRGNIYSLAADGSLWFWPIEPVNDYYNFDEVPYPLIDISRKPRFLGNIFASSKH
jgi:hypothetical protein